MRTAVRGKNLTRSFKNTNLYKIIIPAGRTLKVLANVFYGLAQTTNAYTACENRTIDSMCVSDSGMLTMGRAELL